MTSTMQLATRWQKLSAVLQPWLARHGTWCTSLVGGFMLGRLANAASSQHVIGFGDLLCDVYGINRHVNVISWFCSAVLVGLPLTRVWVGRQGRQVRTLALLANLADGHTDRIIASFARETVAWGPDLTLQLVPDLQNGWPLEEVELRLDGGNFAFPQHRRADYQRFVKDNWDRLGFDQDGTKYALVKNPSAFSDARKLVLEVAKTKYSEVRYFGHCIATVQPERDKLIDETVREGSINFPSSLCMHAVVVTRDRRVLVTKRSHKVSYSPGVWSVSVEEQLNPDDLRGGTDGAVARWACRLLFEELAVERQDYETDRFRILSVFLEADTLNCSVCAILPINLNAAELETVLKAKPRTDYEFSEWKFLTYGELADELRESKLLQHPSTGYRIFLALANRFGASRLADIVFKDRGGA